MFLAAALRATGGKQQERGTPMINTTVITWLFSGGTIAWLVSLENHFSAPAVLASALATIGALAVFYLIRRQPVR